MGVAGNQSCATYKEVDQYLSKKSKIEKLNFVGLGWLNDVNDSKTIINEITYLKNKLSISFGSVNDYIPKKVEADHKKLWIREDPEGAKYFLDENEINIEELPNLLKKADKNPSKPQYLKWVRIRCDDMVTYNYLIKTLNLIEVSGFNASVEFSKRQVPTKEAWAKKQNFPKSIQIHPWVRFTVMLEPLGLNIFLEKMKFVLI